MFSPKADKRICSYHDYSSSSSKNYYFCYRQVLRVITNPSLVNKYSFDYCKFYEKANKLKSSEKHSFQHQLTLAWPHSGYSNKVHKNNRHHYQTSNNAHPTAISYDRNHVVKWLNMIPISTVFFCFGFFLYTCAFTLSDWGSSVHYGERVGLLLDVRI